MYAWYREYRRVGKSAKSACRLARIWSDYGMVMAVVKSKISASDFDFMLRSSV